MLLNSWTRSLSISLNRFDVRDPIVFKLSCSSRGNVPLLLPLCPLTHQTSEENINGKFMLLTVKKTRKHPDFIIVVQNLTQRQMESVLLLVNLFDIRFKVSDNLFHLWQYTILHGLLLSIYSRTWVFHVSATLRIFFHLIPCLTFDIVPDICSQLFCLYVPYNKSIASISPTLLFLSSGWRCRNPRWSDQCPDICVATGTDFKEPTVFLFTSKVSAHLQVLSINKGCECVWASKHLIAER